MSKCCGECATGECGNLDRIVALERELEFHKTELVDTRKRLGEMELVWEQDGRNHERVLNEAHAAIRALWEWAQAAHQSWLNGEDGNAMDAPYLKIRLEHATVIRRASEGK